MILIMIFRQTKLKYENDFCSHIEGLSSSLIKNPNNSSSDNRLSASKMKRVYHNKSSIETLSPEMLKRIDLNRPNERSHMHKPRDNDIMDHNISIEKSMKNKIFRVKKKILVS